MITADLSPSDRERIDRLCADARNLSKLPGPEVSSAVPVDGHQLPQVLWCGRQWAVTRHGLECRDGTHSIGRDRLWESEHRNGWVRRMADKDWIDLDDFSEALRIARRIHARRRY